MRLILLPLLAALLPLHLHAAGGHHDVDDAAVMEPGQCELEGWLRHGRGAGTLLHAGIGCRVGPVELAGASEATRVGGASETSHGLQLKWATPVAEHLSLGLVAAAGWQAHARPRYAGTALVGLLTWQAMESLAIHLNLGRDFVHQGRDATRWGAAAEWSGGGGWSGMAERFALQSEHFVRVGVRRAFGEHFSLDLSRARGLGSAPSTWTLGATWVVDR